MVDFDLGIAEIERDFTSYGIPIDSPGFYDHEAFLEIETANPDYLSNYARLVSQRNYDTEYLRRARTEIPAIASALHGELLRDGRQGACVDTSGVLSKVLEQEGYWNYVVKGSLTMDFPASSGIGRRFFWTIDEGDFAAAHAWVYAPPFTVVDVTIRQQGYTPEEYALLPEMVLAEKPDLDRGTIEDVIAPDIRGLLHLQRIPPAMFFHAINPVLVRFLNAFPACSIIAGETLLKYVPTAVSAPDCSLEGMIGLSGQGRDGLAIYKDVILPALEKLRG